MLTEMLPHAVRLAVPFLVLVEIIIFVDYESCFAVTDCLIWWNGVVGTCHL